MTQETPGDNARAKAEAIIEAAGPTLRSCVAQLLVHGASVPTALVETPDGKFVFTITRSVSPTKPPEVPA